MIPEATVGHEMEQVIVAQVENQQERHNAAGVKHQQERHNTAIGEHQQERHNTVGGEYQQERHNTAGGEHQQLPDVFIFKQNWFILFFVALISYYIITVNNRLTSSQHTMNFLGFMMDKAYLLMQIVTFFVVSKILTLLMCYLGMY